MRSALDKGDACDAARRIGARQLLIQSLAINPDGKRQGAYTVASVDESVTRNAI